MVRSHMRWKSVQYDEIRTCQTWCRVLHDPCFYYVTAMFAFVPMLTPKVLCVDIFAAGCTWPTILHTDDSFDLVDTTWIQMPEARTRTGHVGWQPRRSVNLTNAAVGSGVWVSGVWGWGLPACLPAHPSAQADYRASCGTTGPPRVGFSAACWATRLPGHPAHGRRRHAVA